jgi:hypothetical protein
MDSQPRSPGLETSDFQLLEPPKKHLAGKLFATDAHVKQAVTSWFQILDNISSTPGYKPLYHGETNAKLSATHVLFTHRSWNKVLAQECVLSCFLKLLCTNIQLKEP